MSRLGELLVRENLISLQQLQTAQEEQRKSGTRIGYSLTKLGLIQEQDLTNFLSKQYAVPSINLGEWEVSNDVIALVPAELAKRHQLVPVSRTGATLIVAMADPSNIYAIDDLKFRTGLNIDVAVASEAAIDEAYVKYYEKQVDLDDIVGQLDADAVEIAESDAEVSVIDLEKGAGEAPVIKLVNVMLLNAIKKRASDIHVEPYEKSFRVRYRIDGILYEEMQLPLKLKNAVTSRIKIMSQLDISERRLPQDGRIKLKIGKDKEMDFRVSVLPTLFGEKIVMRLLDKGNLQLDMTKLGFEEKQLKDFMKAIYMPYGMVLVTGPTGSGKTTSLYSALQELNKSTRNISTAEDPVEYNLMGINQVQMHEDVGLNFATALRSFLRQDPNIIMVGEIRDFETAEIAVKAALTGHLVLSTLHTNDAPSTISRLLNMGVEPFLVTASVNLVLAQRLARRICADCRQPVEKNVKALIDLGMRPDVAEKTALFKGTGCPKCANTGYKGRIAIYEVMPFYESVKELVLQGASTAEVKAEAIRSGMQSLRMSGLQKLAEGITTPEEVLRVSVSD
ncbi:MAG: type IV-A pilus assembly ATPase PilB [Polyangia bacterium]